MFSASFPCLFNDFLSYFHQIPYREISKKTAKFHRKNFSLCFFRIPIEISRKISSKNFISAQRNKYAKKKKSERKLKRFFFIFLAVALSENGNVLFCLTRGVNQLSFMFFPLAFFHCPIVQYMEISFETHFGK